MFGAVLTRVHNELMERRVGEIQAMKTVCMGKVHQMSRLPLEGVRQ